MVALDKHGGGSNGDPVDDDKRSMGETHFRDLVDDGKGGSFGEETETHLHEPVVDGKGGFFGEEIETHFHEQVVDGKGGSFGEEIVALGSNRGEELVITNDGEEEEEEEEEEDEEEEEEEEEGEMVDEMVARIDAEEVDEEEEEDDVKGPISSKNELKALPPVPPVNATLEPHHQLLPIGVVSSIIGTQIVVEGMEMHNPLNEGSVLWITEKRLPLGLVDDIFGPVKNPYYLVRYNSESEVPDSVHMGTSISFVHEFANHVLNDGNLYKKGYDASGENDEEVSDEEFSDDEKEAEYKKKLQVSKRCMNGKKAKSKNSKKMGDKNRHGKWKNKKSPLQQESVNERRLSPENNQHNYLSSVGAAVSHINGLSSSTSLQNVSDGSVPPFSPMAQNPQVFLLPSGVWGGVPTLQLQNAVVSAGPPVNNMPWPALNQFPQPCQIPMLNNLPFQQQFNPSLFPNPALPPGGQLNLFTRPTFPPSPVATTLNIFNQSAFGMGLQLQNIPSMNMMNVEVGNQGRTGNLQQFVEQNFNFPPPNNQAPPTFSMGAYTSNDKNPNKHGGW